MNKKETKQAESLEQKLLGLLRASSRSMHVGELRKLMMLDKKTHGQLADQLGLMAAAGLVTELPGGKYRAPKLALAGADRNKRKAPAAPASADLADERNRSPRGKGRSAFDADDDRNHAPRGKGRGAAYSSADESDRASRGKGRGAFAATSSADDDRNRAPHSKGRGAFAADSGADDDRNRASRSKGRGATYNSADDESDRAPRRKARAAFAGESGVDDDRNRAPHGKGRGAFAADSSADDVRNRAPHGKGRGAFADSSADDVRNRAPHGKGRGAFAADSSADDVRNRAPHGKGPGAFAADSSADDVRNRAPHGKGRGAFAADSGSDDGRNRAPRGRGPGAFAADSTADDDRNRAPRGKGPGELGADEAPGRRSRGKARRAFAQSEPDAERGRPIDAQGERDRAARGKSRAAFSAHTQPGQRLGREARGKARQAFEQGVGEDDQDVALAADGGADAPRADKRVAFRADEERHQRAARGARGKGRRSFEQGPGDDEHDPAFAADGDSDAEDATHAEGGRDFEAEYDGGLEEYEPAGRKQQKLKTRSRAERVARSRVAQFQAHLREPHKGKDRRSRELPRRGRHGGPALESVERRRHDDFAYRSARGRAELIGRLSVNTRGFGFVTPEEPGPDIFIPPPALGSALHGDKVRVRVFPSPKGFDGQVLEVIERATHYIGGQLLMLPYATFIEADDERLKARVQVVGELPENARTGQGVIAKVVGFPEHPGEPLLASVVEAFDPAEFAEFEIRRILLSQGVREEFDEEVQAEARAYGDRVTEADCEGRVDYRDLELLTIDPDDARDHDDAVYAEPASGGGYRVIVAIADVSHYVRPGTALDHEALARGCTIYLPSRAIPMLPRELSSHLASLMPEVDRLALAVDLELDREGNVRKHKFVECVMRSAARLSYGGVARALGMTDEGPVQPAAESRKPQLQLLLEVAQLLGAQRKRRGSLDFDLPEAKVKLNPETGEPVSIERSRTDPGVRAAYNLIEEMMLLANEVVARDLSKRKVAAIYRVHGAPNEEKVMAFAELAGTMGFKIDDDIAEQPGKLARFLSTVVDPRHAEVLSYLLLRAMQQATYATDNIGHFGLAAEDYVHFTSPIRRYPDLAIHRIVRKIARGEPLHGKKVKTELAEQAAESSRLERRAMLIEREVVDLYRAMLMRDRVGEEFEGTITGITEHGIFVAIESPCVDVFCRMQSLPPDHYEADQFNTRLVGLATGRSYALFDRILVRIEDVSIARRRISAVPVEVLASTTPQQTGGAGRMRRKKRGAGPELPNRPRNEREQRRRRKETQRSEKRGKAKGKAKRRR